MPGTTNVGQNIRELYAAKKNPSLSSVPSVAAKRPRAQIIAIAESQARKAAGDGGKPHSERGQRGKPGPKPNGKWLSDGE